jgi:Fe-S-cluster formation regulator IscX/YfhJ
MIAKGLVNCLNDKWQDVRQLAVELTNRLSHNIDFGKMRHIASRMHTKVPKEL